MNFCYWQILDIMSWDDNAILTSLEQTYVGDPWGMKSPSMILYSDDDTSENDIHAGREDKDPFFLPSAILFIQSKLLRVLLKEEQLPFTFNAKRGFLYATLFTLLLSPHELKRHTKRERSNFRGQNSDYKISNTHLSLSTFELSRFTIISLSLCMLLVSVKMGC